MERDGVRHPTLLAMASRNIGCHSERDMQRWLRNLHNTQLEPYYLTMDLETVADGAVQPTQVPCLPFWEVLRSLHRAGQQQFEVSMLGPGGTPGLAAFWDRMLKVPVGREHPVAQGLSQ
eukprot:6073981-Alexandrium_andersonii.AAC.1